MGRKCLRPARLEGLEMLKEEAGLKGRKTTKRRSKKQCATLLHDVHVLFSMNSRASQADLMRQQVIVLFLAVLLGLAFLAMHALRPATTLHSLKNELVL